MIERLKKWYINDYQKIVFAIAIAKSEYEKIGAFVTSTLLFITVLKLFFNPPAWFMFALLPFVTITAVGIGTYLIHLGVPKKSAELGNLQNPQLLEILERLKRIEEVLTKQL